MKHNPIIVNLKKILYYKIHPVYLTPIFLILLYSIFIEPDWIEVNHVTIKNQQLSTILENRKIILISDLHIRSIGYRENDMIKKINELQPDLILIAGEFIGRSKSIEGHQVMVNDASRVIAQLHARYGKYAVLGEGDLYSPWIRIKMLVESLNKANVTILHNEIQDIRIEDNVISLIGLSVTFEGVKQLMNNTAQPGYPAILLSHKTDFFMTGIDALEVNLAEHTENNTYNWGWQDNAYWSNDAADIYFENDGTHTIRILRREDGVAIDQILLTREKLQLKDLARLDQNNCYIKKPGDILIVASDIPDDNIKGSWDKQTDTTACSNFKLVDTPDFHRKVEQPLNSPGTYFEASFEAQKDTQYHLWLRMKANDASSTSDSVYVQFSDSLDTDKLKRYQVGRTLKDVFQVELMLAGDTHGGQLRFPYSYELLNLLGANIHYPSGLYHLDFSDLYVNRGIGWSNIPVRFFCRPEITVLRFVNP